MKTTLKPKTTASRKSPRTAKTVIAGPSQADPDRPGGKLGLILDRLATKSGATADELVKATGWQRHSILGALSKLKARGFAFNLDAHADRKAYRLTRVKG